jgi:hypothetical protein
LGEKHDNADLFRLDQRIAVIRWTPSIGLSLRILAWIVSVKSFANEGSRSISPAFGEQNATKNGS